jgi:hypothetical protein
MNLQTQINAYCRMARVLELIQRTDEIIAVSAKYLDNHKKYMQPIVDFHGKEVKRYTKVRDRLIKYGNNLRYRILDNMYLPAYSEETELDLLPF